jgi:hypothetical protein
MALNAADFLTLVVQLGCSCSDPASTPGPRPGDADRDHSVMGHPQTTQFCTSDTSK